MLSLDSDVEDSEDVEENKDCSPGPSVLNNLVWYLEVPKIRLSCQALGYSRGISTQLMLDSKFHDPQQQLKTFFFMEVDLSNCKNIKGLLVVHNTDRYPCNQRFFYRLIQKKSLKTVLLQNGRKL